VCKLLKDCFLQCQLNCHSVDQFSEVWINVVGMPYLRLEDLIRLSEIHDHPRGYLAYQNELESAMILCNPHLKITRRTIWSFYAEEVGLKRDY